jgi:predicted dithiol-disulfide oxidoreductase (DUF899 family)
VTAPEIATREEWRARRIDLLGREKELNRLRDELAEQRRRLPWAKLAAYRARMGSSYARGLDPISCAYQLLDLVPKGRDEAGLSWPMEWLRRHDDYD